MVFFLKDILGFSTYKSCVFGSFISKVISVQWAYFL